MAATASEKYLCLIRHGQGEHNPRSNPLALAFVPAMLKRDAKLTGKGKKQAAALNSPMQHMPFDLILVSPLTRTIQTATAAFEGHTTPKRLCHLMCERATMPADMGTPKAEVSAKRRDWKIQNPAHSPPIRSSDFPRLFADFFRCPCALFALAAAEEAPARRRVRRLADRPAAHGQQEYRII